LLEAYVKRKLVSFNALQQMGVVVVFGYVQVYQ
jgi:hypothetical protein